MGSEPGSVHVIVHSDRTRIVLSGEVDADLGPDLTEATSDAEATGLPIEVDAQHVTFMDSSGIAFLARLATRTSERVRVINAPETVLFLLEVTRIGELLDVVDENAGSDDEPATVDHGLPTIGPGGRSRGASPEPDDVA
nr:STAS domain-containing protein [Cellulomonas bogoriensis]